MRQFELFLILEIFLPLLVITNTSVLYKMPHLITFIGIVPKNATFGPTCTYHPSHFFRKKGGQVHKAPTIVGSGEGSMYVALPRHTEELNVSREIIPKILESVLRGWAAFAEPRGVRRQSPNPTKIAVSFSSALILPINGSMSYQLNRG